MATVNVAIPNPFAQTALFSNNEQAILHYAGCRLRVTGSGNLDSTLFDLDSQLSQPLKVIVMASSNEDEPDILANFKGQKVMLNVGTDEIDEIFEITRIILFAKQLWADYAR